MLELLVAGDIDRDRLGAHLLHEALLAHLVVEVIAIAQSAHEGDVGVGGDFVKEVHHQGVEENHLVEGQESADLIHDLGVGVVEILGGVQTDGENHLVEHQFGLLEDSEVADVEGIEGSRIEPDAGAPPFQIFDEELHVGLRLGEALAEAPEEIGASFAVFLEAQELELAENLELVGKEVNLVAMQQDIAVELVELARHRVDFALALGGQNNGVHGLGRRLGQFRAEGGRKQVEDLRGLLLVVLALRIPHDIMEQSGQKHLRGRFRVRDLRVNQIADAFEVVERVEKTVGLAVSGKDLVQPGRVQIQAVAVVRREDFTDVAHRDLRVLTADEARHGK